MQHKKLSLTEAGQKICTLNDRFKTDKRWFKLPSLETLDRSCESWKKNSGERPWCHFISEWWKSQTGLGWSEKRELWLTLWLKSKEEACLQWLFFSFLHGILVEYNDVEEHLKKECLRAKSIYGHRQHPKILMLSKRGAEMSKRGRYIFPIKRVAF